MAFEGAPEPADRTEVLRYKIARAVAALADGEAGDATAANQATQIAAEQAILAKLIAAPATEAKQDAAITQETAINTRLGEVQASPTPNTVLDRLKALLTGIVLAAGNAIIGKVGIDQTTDGTTNRVNATDAGPAWTSARGVAGVRFTSADQSAGVASVTSAPTSGQKLVITDLVVSSDTALRIDFNVESDATVIETMYLAANSTVQQTIRSKWKLGTADKKLQVRTSAAGNISVTPYYYSEA